MRNDVEKAINDSYDHQRMCIEQRYQMKQKLYTFEGFAVEGFAVEGFAVIALFIALMALIQNWSIDNKLEEHMKNCNCKTVIEKGK